MADEIMIGDLPVERADPRVAVVQPDRSRANLIEGLGSAASDAIQGVQQYRTRRAIGGVSQAYDVAGRLTELGAEFDPVTGAVLNEEDLDADAYAQISGQIAAVQQTSADAFSKIKAGIEQGRGAGGNPFAAGLGAANLQIENQIRKISALTPGFEDVVRSTAREILGYDPTGFGIRNILQVPKQADSPDQNPRIKAFNDEVEFRMMRAQVLGFTPSVDTIRTQVATEDARTTQRASLEEQVSLGNVSSDAATTEYFQTLENPLLSMLKTSAMSLDPESGVTLSNMNNADRSAFLKNQQAISREQEYNSAVQFARNAAVANGGRITNQDLVRIREQVDRRWQDMDAIIDTMSQSAYAGRWADELTKLSNFQAWQITPLIKFLNEGYNESIGLEFVKAMANTASNSQLRLLIDRNPLLSQVTANGDPGVLTGVVGNTLNDLFNGQTPVITGDPIVDRDTTKEIVADLWRNSANNPEGRREIANQLTRAQPEMAYGMFLADPLQFARQLTPESWGIIRNKFGTETETYLDAFSNNLTQELESARNPVGPSGMTGDTTGNDYQRLNAALTAIDNSGFIRDRNGNVVFSTNIVRDRSTSIIGELVETQGRLTNGIANTPITAVRYAYNYLFGDRLVEGANKRIAPMLSNNNLISNVTQGRANNLDEFNDIWRRAVKGKAIEAQLEVERERESVNRAFFDDRRQQTPEEFQAEQQQYVQTLEGLLELQQERNVTTFGGAQ